MNFEKCFTSKLCGYWRIISLFITQKNVIWDALFWQLHFSDCEFWKRDILSMNFSTLCLDLVREMEQSMASACQCTLHNGMFGAYLCQLTQPKRTLRNWIVYNCHHYLVLTSLCVMSSGIKWLKFLFLCPSKFIPWFCQILMYFEGNDQGAWRQSPLLPLWGSSLLINMSRFLFKKLEGFVLNPWY